MCKFRINIMNDLNIWRFEIYLKVQMSIILFFVLILTLIIFFGSQRWVNNYKLQSKIYNFFFWNFTTDLTLIPFLPNFPFILSHHLIYELTYAPLSSSNKIVLYASILALWRFLLDVWIYLMLLNFDNITGILQ
jgi:hypothetical protein